MIDLEKTRRLHGRSDDRTDHLCDPVEHCRECAIEALCREVEYLRWYNDRVRRRVVQALMEINDRTDGDFPALDNALGAIEALLTGEDPKARNPTWLPAPDSKPPELADAQMVEVRDRKWRWMRYRADKVAWHELRAECWYRPLYSDSGHALCSAAGLEEWAWFVATDEDGEVWQYREKPVNPLPQITSCMWEGNGQCDTAPESHRRPGPWYDSLMEVMR